MDYKKLAELLFADIKKTPQDYEAEYPKRGLSEGALVTRLAPSPTGFIHLGNLYGALVDERLAHQGGGVCYLRIEDTDEKREVEGAVPVLLDVLSYFGIEFDEGACKADKPGCRPSSVEPSAGETGAYGPYWQSMRSEIYKACVKQLVAEGAETRNEVDFLKNTGCDYIQGFYFSRPLQEEEFLRYIEQRQIKA